MIIGLSGNYGSGKDAICLYLMSKYDNVYRLAFSDKIKESVAACFGVSVNFIEKLKNRTDITIKLVPNSPISDSDYDELIKPFKPLTMRGFLQLYGTEAHRNLFSEDFWVDLLMDRDFRDDCCYIITDVRFPNEARAIRQRGGIIVNVYRPLAEGAKDNHESECGVKELVDYVIDNSGDWNRLRLELVKFVRYLEGKFYGKSKFRFIERSTT